MLIRSGIGRVLGQTQVYAEREGIVLREATSLNVGMSETSQPRRRGSTATSGHVDLMEAVAENRDVAAFSELFKFYAPRLRAYLIRTGTSEGIVEELVQEVMLTAWRRATLYNRTQGGVSTWLYTIARNTFIDHIRRNKRPQYDANDTAADIDESADVEAEVSRREGAAQLHGALENLPPEQLETIKLFYFGHKTHSEIAAELNLPLGTVKSRVRLAVEHLRRHMKEYRDG